MKKETTLLDALPEIPEKLYFSMGEASILCGVKPHVLRYWEEEFKQISPVKRRGNRRYYQKKDLLLIRKIRELLYQKGFTIEGARQQLASEREIARDNKDHELVQKMLKRVKEISKILS